MHRKAQRLTTKEQELCGLGASRDTGALAPIHPGARAAESGDAIPPVCS